MTHDSYPTAWGANMGAIERRWPSVAARLAATELRHAEVRNGTLCYRGLQVVSAYDRLAEAEAQASADYAKPNPTRCYGIGLGELPTLLATRGPIKIVLPNLEIARRSFSHVGHPWLHMDGVELACADEVEWERGPFACVSAECEFADGQGYEIRDRVLMRLDDEVTHAHLDADHARIWEQQQANRARPHYKIDSLCGRWSNLRAAVVGAGPTLTTQIPWLKSGGARPIIAAPATLRVLLLHDIVPDVVVLMESGTSNVGYLENLPMVYASGHAERPEEALRRVTLAYTPQADPKFLDAWPGPLCVFGDADLRGTVLHSCADLAVRMGASEVTLIGFDCCRPGGRDYADGAGVPGEGYPESPYCVPLLDGNGRHVLATPAMCRWLRGMQDIIAERPGVKFYKRGRAGAELKGATWID